MKRYIADADISKLNLVPQSSSENKNKLILNITDDYYC